MSTATAPATAVRKKTSATTLRLVRKTHLYFGLFISPALLFFAFTGAVQTLSLHEVLGSYKPPMVVARLAQLHKTQTLAFPPGKGPKGSDKPAVTSKTPQPELTLSRKQQMHLPMKIFFLVVSVGLLTSTATGIYMAYKYERNRVLVTGALLAGVVLPIVLLRL